MEQYLERRIDHELIEWKESEPHKPLLLRGARQVGKTSAVRHLAAHFEHYVEINFERQETMAALFDGDLDVRQICTKIARLVDVPIEGGRSLLFLDEIQSCPRAVMSLRFFREDFPQLHVVAAGSLLEFALAELPTFGVGRIRSLFMYPMTFDEFLTATAGRGLWELKRAASPGHPLDRPIHERLVEAFRSYLLVGGLPEAVATWTATHDYGTCAQVQADILTGYESDFAKYKRRVDPMLIRAALHGVAHQVGQKITYSQIARDVRSYRIREALDLLTLAGLIVPVIHSDGGGLPLGAEADPSCVKYLLADSGLLLRILHLDLGDLRALTEQILVGSAADLVNRGALAEMVAGLELLRYAPSAQRGELFYWTRHERNSVAEVDYLTARNLHVLPIEVKAGTQGGMKSLWDFMHTKHVQTAVRTSLENFGRIDNDGLTCDVIPLYALSNL